jgi:hypothetical protein
LRKAIENAPSGDRTRQGSKTGSKPTLTARYKSTDDTGKSYTNQHHGISLSISGLQVHVLPGSPNVFNDLAVLIFRSQKTVRGQRP